MAIRFTLTARNKHSLEDFLLSKSGTVKETNKFVKPSLYAKHLKTWLRFYELNRTLLIVDGEAFKQTPWTELARVESFLGLEPTIGKEAFYFNETRGFFCLRSTGCMSKRKGNVPPELSAGLRRKLEVLLDSYNKQLWEKYSLNFTWA